MARPPPVQLQDDDPAAEPEVPPLGGLLVLLTLFTAFEAVVSGLVALVAYYGTWTVTAPKRGPKPPPVDLDALRNWTSGLAFVVCVSATIAAISLMVKYRRAPWMVLAHRAVVILATVGFAGELVDAISPLLYTMGIASAVQAVVISAGIGLYLTQSERVRETFPDASE